MNYLTKESILKGCSGLEVVVYSQLRLWKSLLLLLLLSKLIDCF